MGDRPSMPIQTAAISWTDSSGAEHIRVYSCDGYTAIERCWDGGWTTGGFKASASSVSATCWQSGGENYIRVYCTFQDKTVEYCSDAGGAWYQGSYTTT